jgi:hypothetical protein
MLNVYLGDLFLARGINVYFEDMFLKFAVFMAYFDVTFLRLAYYAARLEHSCL